MSDDAATNEVDPELEQAAGAYFNDLTGTPSESPDGGEGAGSGSSGSVEPDPQPSTSTAPIVDEWAWDDGFKLTKDQARVYAELEAYLYANPAKAEALAKFLGGEQDTTSEADTSSRTPSTSAGSPQVSLDDIADPEVRAVYEQLQAQQQELERLRELTQGAQGYITTQQEQNAQSLMTRATTSFQKEHNLSDDEMDNLSSVAARLQVLPALMQPVDPITGQARRVDPLAAIEEALTIAYWQIPEFRERAISSEMDNSTKDRARKQKLSSLQGSSGSVPREQPVADTPQGRREQMIAEVAGMIGKGN